MSIKYEVWHGGELYQSYPTEERAIEVARILNKEHGTVWINKVTTERINFK